MIVREQVPLSELTTLRAGGPARFVISCETDDDVRAALVFAQERSHPTYTLGEGSNVLADQEGYEGVIIMPRESTLTFDEQGSSVEITVGAGVVWDALVQSVAERKLWGIENLAGIPGLVGASPVQNIGAYGAEAADSIVWVEALRKDTGEMIRLSKDECAFAYRDSRFKQSNDLIIVRVAFSLQARGEPDISYADLTKAKERGEDLTTPAAIGEAVRRIRARKFPNLAEHGTAGSFFKNPTLTLETYERVKNMYPDLPGYPVEGGVKIPLAYILDRILGLRGFRMGPAWLFDTQPLVLVLDAGGTSRDVDVLAHHVSALVEEKLKITIEREVCTLRK